MIDLHCHILPNMDDGSENSHVSLEMAMMAEQNNINVIVATPHFTDYNNVDEFVYIRNDKAVALNEDIRKAGCNVAVACGAEVFLDSHIFTADSLDELTINGSKYMLCEFTLKPFDTQKAVLYVDELLSRDYIPIIAHPERYVTFAQNPQIVNELWDMGCRFQINASGLAGSGGRAMQDFSLELIQRGFADFVSTDAHSATVRRNNMLDKIRDFPEELSQEQIEYLIHTAPLAILKKEILPPKEVEYF